MAMSRTAAGRRLGRELAAASSPRARAASLSSSSSSSASSSPSPSPTVAAIREAQAAAGVGPSYPVAFRCEAAQRWAASGAWRPRALVRQRTEPLTVKRSTRREFMYIESGKKELLPDLAGGDLEVTEQAAADFFRACAAQAQAQAQAAAAGAAAGPASGGGGHAPLYHYFTGPVAEAFPPLAESTTEWTDMVVDMEHWAAQGAAPEQLGYLSVWIGGEGR